MSDTTIDQAPRESAPVLDFAAAKRLRGAAGASAASASAPKATPSSAPAGAHEAGLNPQAEAFIESLYTPLHPWLGASSDLRAVSQEVLNAIALNRTNNPAVAQVQRYAAWQLTEREAEIRRAAQYAQDFSEQIPTIVEACQQLYRLAEALDTRDRSTKSGRSFHDRCIRKHDIPYALEWLERGISAARNQSWSYDIAACLDGAVRLVVRLRDNGPVT